MIWTVLQAVTGLIGAFMVLVLAAYWREFVVARPRPRSTRPRLWFHAELLGTRLFTSFERVPDGAGSGISATYGVDHWGRRRLQSLDFSSAEWRSRDAARWLRRNHYVGPGLRHVRR